jgi:hypothetical protein
MAAMMNSWVFKTGAGRRIRGGYAKKRRKEKLKNGQQNNVEKFKLNFFEVSSA